MRFKSPLVESKRSTFGGPAPPPNRSWPCAWLWHQLIQPFESFNPKCSELMTVDSKKLQRILQCFIVKLLQRTTVSAIYSELLLFFYIYFRQILCFLHCKM